MKASIAAFATVVCVLPLSTPSEAGGMGRFLGGLLARGAVAAAVHSTSSSSSSSAVKSYTPDVLTVTQLADCMKQASKLDTDSDRIESDRTTLKQAQSDVDQSSASVEQQRSSVNTRSSVSVNAFNKLVDRHNGLVAGVKGRQVTFNTAVDAHNVEVNAYNGACAKKYYADDLGEAKKLAGISGS
jgi:hypothetical protein